MSPNDSLSDTQPADRPAAPAPPDLPPAHGLATYVADGARIAGILVIWGVFALVGTAVFGNLGSTGGLLGRLAAGVGGLFLLAGLLNALLFVVYRGIDYWRV